MNQIMLDLETMGNGPRAAIIAIGAVAFDPATGETGEKFYGVVDLESSVAAGMVMDASTVLWWLKQSDAARAAFERKGKCLGDALFDFTVWMNYFGDVKERCVWGNGATFDNVILSYAYQCCAMPRPWSYKGDRCYRTMRALYPDVVQEAVGTAHNAVDDAEHQALHLMKMLGAKP